MQVTGAQPTLLIALPRVEWASRANMLEWGGKEQGVEQPVAIPASGAGGLCWETPPVPQVCFWSQVDRDKAGFGHSLLSILSGLLGRMPVAGQWQREHGGVGSSSELIQESDVLISSMRCLTGPRAAPSQEEGPVAPQGAHIRKTTGCPPPFQPGRPGVLPLLLVAGYSCAPEWISSSFQLIKPACVRSHQRSQVGALLPACLCCFINTTGCW